MFKVGLGEISLLESAGGAVERKRVELCSPWPLRGWKEERTAEETEQGGLGWNQTRTVWCMVSWKPRQKSVSGREVSAVSDTAERPRRGQRSTHWIR